jgi:nucleotide-binding universal stress UspA family protein
MIKTILVHLDGGSDDYQRLGYAANLARAFDAHLTGLYVALLPDPAPVTDGATLYIGNAVSEARETAVRVAAALASALTSYDVRTEFRTIETFRAGASSVLSSAARLADIYIGSRPAAEAPVFGGLEEAVIFGAGKGCILVPPTRLPNSRVEVVTIAWKNTRESARAVAEALPILRAAKRVIVATVPDQSGDEPGDIGRHLSRHGVSSDVRTLRGFPDVGTAILNEVDITGSDLLVMGAYGHSRFREWMLGGATRLLMARSPIPVLFAH